MPTYDYLCPNGHRFEVIHGLMADPPAACPICGAAPVRKAFSAPSIHFKGTGWAKKDRSTTSKPPAAEPAAAATSGKDGKTDSDSKADSKAGSDPKSGTQSTSGSESSSSTTPAASKDSSSEGGASTSGGTAAD